MKKYLAEFIGSATLVIIGCGAVAISGLGGSLTGANLLSPLATLPIALAFGLAVTAMAYGIGPISGCHINPAVTVGVWAAGRMPTSEVPGYIVAQVLGAIVGAAILVVILSGKGGGYDVATAGLGQTGWGNKALGDYSTMAAIVAEFVGTFIFVVVILGATSKAGATPVAGLAIGLTLVAVHLAIINVTGSSVNPSRSLGPAIFVGGQALAQVWLYLIVPPIAAFCAGMLFKTGTLEG